MPCSLNLQMFAPPSEEYYFAPEYDPSAQELILTQLLMLTPETSDFQCVPLIGSCCDIHYYISSCSCPP